MLVMTVSPFLIIQVRNGGMKAYGVKVLDTNSY